MQTTNQAGAGRRDATALLTRALSDLPTRHLRPHRDTTTSRTALRVGGVLRVALLGAALTMATTPLAALHAAGGNGGGTGGGAGAAGFTGTNGTDGTGVGGGGGGGAGGGTGGNGGGASSPNGIGGGTSGANGVSGADGTAGGGGGGGGGLNGVSTVTLSNGAPLNGGTGGAGGAGSTAAGGGGGGAGGYGAIVSGTGASSNTSTIIGGAGGDGGTATGAGGFGGNGGDGGVGVQFTGSGGSLNNSGSIAGGNGGTGGAGSAGATTGTPGAGGAGMVGSGLTITNSGSISGGLGGDGTTRADAIQFTGGANTLTLQSGWSLVGNLAVDGTASLTFNQSASQTVSNVITGTGSVVQTGAGTLLLLGANTYSGGTTICGTTCGAAGGSSILQVFSSTPGTSSSIGTGTLTFDGGTLQSAQPAPLTFSNAVQLTGNGGIIDVNGSSLTFTGNITDASGSSNGTLTVTNTSVQGTPALTLSGSNSYSGTTNIVAGTVIAGSTTGFAPNSAFKLKGGAALMLNGFNNTIASLSDGTGGGGTVSNGGAANATLTLGGANGGTGTFSGAIQDGGGGGTLALTMQGTGTQSLSGASTYSGGTTVSGGTLVAANATALGTGAATVATGATLNVSGVTIGNALSLAGSGFGGSGAAGPGALAGTGIAGVSGPITLSGSAVLFGVATAGDNLTISGAIGDGGGGSELLKDGSGTLTLSAANTYTGATVIEGGTLAMGAGGSIASSASVQLGQSGAAFDISGGGNQAIGFLSGVGGTSVNLGANTLTVNAVNAQPIFSGVIAGSGGLTLAAGGAVSGLTLEGTNTYTGTTTIGAGAKLILLGNGTTTTGNVASSSVVDNGSLMFEHSDNMAFGATLSGSGTLTQAGIGTLTVSGSNASFSGLTTVAAGTLMTTSGSALGSGAITVDSGATLSVGPGIPNSVLLAGSGFNGAGALVVNGPGKTFSGPAGLITLIGNATITVPDTVEFDTGGTVNESGGSFALTKAGGGLMLLNQSGQYSGGTNVVGGILQEQSPSATPFGSGPINVQSGASLVIPSSNFTSITIANAFTLAGTGVAGSNVGTAALVIDLARFDSPLTLSGPITLASDASIGVGGSSVVATGIISGNAALTVQSGQLVLAAADTYTGATNIARNAMLVLGDAGTTGSIASQTVNIATGGSLIFNRADTLTYGGTIQGVGSMVVMDGGTVILNGSSGGFTGSTTVGPGTLEIGDAGNPGAALGGNVTVNGAGTLMGHGTIGGNVTNVGNVRPGGSIGVLSVAGNYTQTSAGTLTIEITPNVAAGAGVGYDQLHVGGSATLAGTLAIIDDPGTYSVGSRYTILTAGSGVSGTFATTTYNPAFAAYITPVITYEANDVLLSLAPTPAAGGAPPPLFNGGQEVPDMLTAMVSAARGVGGTVLGDVCGPTARRLLTQGEGCVVRPLAEGYRGEMWMRGLGGIGSVSSGGSRFSFDDSYGGALIGAGVTHGGLTVGFGGGYLMTAENFSNGSNASQNAGLGFVYGRYANGPLWLGGMAAYGGGTISGSRALPGTGLSASGNRGGDFASIDTRAAYDISLGSVTLEPRASLSYYHAGQGSFSESGAGLLDLSYAATHADALEGALVGRVMSRFAAGNWWLVPWAEAGVRSALNGQSRSVAMLDGVIAGTASGVSPAPVAAVAGLGVNAAMSNSLDLFAAWQGSFSANQTGNAFSAGVQYRF